MSINSALVPTLDDRLRKEQTQAVLDLLAEFKRKLDEDNSLHKTIPKVQGRPSTSHLFELRQLSSRGSDSSLSATVRYRLNGSFRGLGASASPVPTQRYRCVMIPEFDECGNLPPGIHHEIVTRYATSVRRRELLDGLLDALRSLKGRRLSHCLSRRQLRHEQEPSGRLRRLLGVGRRHTQPAPIRSFWISAMIVPHRRRTTEASSSPPTGLLMGMVRPTSTSSSVIG
jgi:hypothetical protein